MAAAAPSGTRMLAAAVLLMKFDSTVVSKAKPSAAPINPSPASGIPSTSHAARPVSVTATPSDRPPAIRISTSQRSWRISATPMTPVTDSTVIGTNATTAAGAEPNIHSNNVMLKTSTTTPRCQSGARGPLSCADARAVRSRYSPEA